jgi:hypothetical protein
MAPRVPIPLREVVYMLSPYQQEIMKQGIEHLPAKAAKFVKRVRFCCRCNGGEIGLCVRLRCRQRLVNGGQAQRAKRERPHCATHVSATTTNQPTKPN